MGNKQCPICKMEQPEANQHCVGCKAVFDDTPKGATATPTETDAEELARMNEAADDAAQAEATAEVVAEEAAAETEAVAEEEARPDDAK